MIYYGKDPCISIEEAYCRFRDDYNLSLGKGVHLRLNRVGQRKERVHGFRSYYPEFRSNYLGEKFDGYGRVACRLLGIVGIAYVHIIGCWDYPDLPEEDLWDFFDWMLDKNSDGLKVVDRTLKMGRTTRKRKLFK